jgi:hypothetical protein
MLIGAPFDYSTKIEGCVRSKLTMSGYAIDEIDLPSPSAERRYSNEANSVFKNLPVKNREVRAQLIRNRWPNSCFVC